MYKGNRMTSLDPTCNKEEPIELELCEFTLKEYAWFDIVNGVWLPIHDRYQRVNKHNLKEYLQTIKNIAV